MGKSAWRYFVPFQADAQAALDDLRADVFARRDFHANRRARKATTMADAIRLAGEDGTHSILDVTRVRAEPAPTPYWAWFILGRRSGVEPSEDECRARRLADLNQRPSPLEVAPLSATQVLEFFATDRPTRAQVDAALDGLPLTTCFYLVVYDDAGQPRELCFVGASGD